ncbi:bifunctional diaminohydroxyphosphoribosylaminopyrimidine deaminase/5-amino-6-(5-phosphoribosylamino)uracil reductase RibD [Mannheimia sp. AT1]|uniref:Riboflavin biosynthesis protein RibD n=1 Tax=Mannheimia cairinae TaxID=3025936 RepID=A0ABT5MN36_9PAST|nr:bifunctional diaminohydroxyphosphoribosylaminopyrimidine deaminase/5-amino-6-(5-phosphoribosylamino)uracil reductase RibD [Mannheimia cairinae]MDD0823602.1 bifunctional diaminohydroxyphosphoribosylaminopyrimidine deaminase/5-amino-6-(5-phosphoribosylamino)uracil reductase RibD [Mannheimia cairinae]MDD0825466.1 bifunctional diaminohydroxyphosphoribosylaminopyrimidine deaminase/5-amino-6-(5-phosphoribosylamino)uracil reductase RibD [Mannheimia cairinae]
MTDAQYMAYAIELAKKARGWTNPNPLVGCVIVKNGKIVAEGYHEKYGQWHAERNAILRSEQDLTGAIAYVTLEPCCHQGRTPPCSDLLIERGIKKVFIGSRDPNPLVSGKGAKQLKAAGVEVIEDFMRAECDELNPIFFHYIQTKRPYVLLKYAMTADGKIATHTGESKWITGELARAKVQQTRHQYSAIMVGVETVLADNPMLNSRMPNAKQPVRIVCDSQLRTPLDSQLVQTAKQYRTIIATLNNDSSAHQAYQQFGVEIIVTSALNKRVNLPEFLQKLGEMQIDSLLIEGGASLNFSALQAGCVNRVHCYIAPKLVGGKTAKTPIGGEGIGELSQAVKLKLKSTELIGEDILLDYVVQTSCKG